MMIDTLSWLTDDKGSGGLTRRGQESRRDAGGLLCFSTPPGAGMVRIVDHLGAAELQAGWRESKDATLARHYQVIWLLAERRSCVEVARLTGFVRRWVAELAER